MSIPWEVAMGRWALLWLVVPAVAWPCGNDVVYSVELSVHDLVAAERKLEAGDYRGVLRDVEGYDGPSRRDLVRRYRILYATAVFRFYDVRRFSAEAAAALGCSGDLATSRPGRAALPILARMRDEGAFPDRRGRRALWAVLAYESAKPNACQRHAEHWINMLQGSYLLTDRWLRIVRLLHENDPQDPVVTALAAEGMSRFDEQADAARGLLDELDLRDLVPDAAAWAVLARLRVRNGDGPAAAKAAARCRPMAQDADPCPASPTG
jgi:hypothetical protein